MAKNFYTILQIKSNSTQSEIKQSYRKLVKIYHPDICKDKDAEQKFKLIQEAYEVLSDENKRKNYDYSLNNKDASFSYDQTTTDIDFKVIEDMMNNVQSLDFNYAEIIERYFKTEKIVFHAFLYFWKTFWVGGKSCFNSLNNGSASKIMLAFLNNYHILEMKRSIQNSGFDHVTYKEIKQMFVSISNKIDNLYDQSKIFFIKSLIVEDNIFDDEGSTMWWILLSDDVIKMMQKFETVHFEHEFRKSKYSPKKKKVYFGSFGSSLLTILSIVIIASILF